MCLKNAGVSSITSIMSTFASYCIHCKYKKNGILMGPLVRHYVKKTLVFGLDYENTK